VAVSEFLLRRWHRLWQSVPPVVRPWQPSPLAALDPTAATLLATRGRLESILKENILPYWMSCLDLKEGGYRHGHSAIAGFREPGPRYTVPQAGTTWFFSRLYGVSKQPDALEAARCGYDVLRARLWDREQGGFVWSIGHGASSEGGDGRKHLLAQCFGLYGVAEFARTSGELEAAGFAMEVATFLDQRFRDCTFGGYSGGYPLWGRPDLKRADEQTHALEALTAMWRIAPAPWIRDRVVELLHIHTGTIVRKGYGALTETFDQRWNPVIEDPAVAVCYGHDFEAMWLVVDACHAISHPIALAVDWMRMIGELALRWGWDRRRGGVYHNGPLDGPAVDRRKVWWVQAEALVGSLLLYRVTGDRRYADLYLSVLDWVEGRQLDRQYGDWHTNVETDGRITGNRAGPWRAPYHNGRAMLMCLDLLQPGGVQLFPGTALQLD